MSALDTAKEIGRMAATATLGKDVIDLLKEKAALLAEQVATLEKENTEFKKQVGNLQQELARLRPAEELEPDAIRFLRLLFGQPGMTLSQITGQLGIEKGMAEYHRDVLANAKMIGLPMVMTMGREPPYRLLTKGREYLVKQGHVGSN